MNVLFSYPTRYGSHLQHLVLQLQLQAQQLVQLQFLLQNSVNQQVSAIMLILLWWKNTHSPGCPDILTCSFSYFLPHYFQISM